MAEPLLLSSRPAPAPDGASELRERPQPSPRGADEPLGQHLPQLTKQEIKSHGFKPLSVAWLIMKR